MADYAENAVFISNLGGVLEGVDAIRAVFAAAGDFPGIEKTAEHVEGGVAYVTWEAAGITFGTNTFVVRDGKIVVQTVAMHLASAWRRPATQPGCSTLMSPTAMVTISSRALIRQPSAVRVQQS